VRLAALTAVLVLASCGDGAPRRVVHGPQGITAELAETLNGGTAANRLEVFLRSPRSSAEVKIFSGSGGSFADVVFQNNLVIVQYCQPTRYEVASYVYSVGDDYAYTDIRIAVATVDSQIGTRRFCRGSGANRPSDGGQG
jgi:hypothetical protein